MKAHLERRELGIILLVVVVSTVVALPAGKRIAQAKARTTCANNMKQIGLVLKMYSNESRGGKFPPVSAVRDNFIPDLTVLYPEYVRDLELFIDPASAFADGAFRSRRTERLHPDCVSGRFYNYTGYLLTGDDQALALFVAYRSMSVSEFRSDDHSLPVPVWETPFPKSGLAVLWDRVPLAKTEFAHRRPRGGNVLILDGHVEFVEYSPYNNPSLFPMTRLSAETFGAARPELPGHCIPN